MKFKIPRLLGDINDSDTQFTATAKKYQEMILVGGIVLIGALAYGGITAYIGEGRSGTWRYGLCKVFLEQYTAYPQSLVILDSGEGQNAAMIGYLATNPYGAQQSQEMECFYSSGPAGITMSRVTINRKPLDLIKTGDTVNANATNDNQTLSYQDIFNLQEMYDIKTKEKDLEDELRKLGYIT